MCRCYSSETLRLRRHSRLLYSTVHIHTHEHLITHAHSQAQGLNLRRGRSLGGKRTVDMNDEQTDVVFR